MSDYNGWSNKETWCVGLWLMDMFRDIAKENTWEKESLSEHLEEATWEILEVKQEGGSLLLDMIQTYMHDVNWEELAVAALED
jgi:hypothetical protein